MPQIEKQDSQEIDSLLNKMAVDVSDSGQAALQIKLLEADLEELNGKMKEYSIKFKELLMQEQELLKRLSSKYGTGSINFDTGEFTPEK
jgi:predicted transcriptional regulator